MASGIFTTFPITVVEAMRDGMVSQIATNKILVSYTENGGGRTKQFAMSHVDFLHEIQYALRALDPVTYGYNMTRTRVGF